jgi:hypothetical protein
MRLSDRIMEMSETKSTDEIVDYIFELRRQEDEWRRKQSKSIIFKIQTHLRLIKWRIKGLL